MTSQPAGSLVGPVVLNGRTWQPTMRKIAHAALTLRDKILSRVRYRTTVGRCSASLIDCQIGGSRHKASARRNCAVCANPLSENRADDGLEGLGDSLGATVALREQGGGVGAIAFAPATAELCCEGDLAQ